MTCNTNNQTVEVVNNNSCCHTTEHSCKYDVTLTVSDIWMMPAVNETTVLHIPDCKNVLPESWLWNKSVGYLKVKRYNNVTGETVVENVGLFGNAEPATVFPSCMDFVITAPYPIENVCDISLQADFISPAVGNTGIMTVSNASLFRKNFIIVVDIYQYIVEEVLNNTQLKVLNDGLGKDGTIEVPCDGSCVPIKIINADSVCVQDTVNSANAIVVCQGGNSKLLVGNENHQFAYWDNSTGEWKLINSNIEVDCTVTTIAVQITAGNAGPYAVYVKDTSVFKVGDKLTIGEIHNGFTVTEVTDEIIRVTFNVAPTENDIWDIGTRICIVDCCDWIPQVIEGLEQRISTAESNITNLQVTVNNHTQQIRYILDNMPEPSVNTDLLTSPTSVLSIDSGSNRVFGVTPATITLDTDLSKYDNTDKHFVINGANNGTSTGTFTIYSGNTDSSNGDRTLNFNRIKAGNNVTISSASGVLTIAATGGGSTGILDTNSVKVSPTVTEIWTAGNHPVNPTDANAVHVTGTLAPTVTFDSTKPVYYNITAYFRAGFTLTTVHANINAYVSPRIRLVVQDSNGNNLDNIEVEEQQSLEGVATIGSGAESTPVRDDSSSIPYLPLTIYGKFNAGASTIFTLHGYSWITGYTSDTFRIEWQVHYIQAYAMWYQL